MTSFICVEPLSPTYSTLPRLNTLVLLLFFLLSPSASWATSGALAALMARTAVIAFHAITLLAVLISSKDYETQGPLAILPVFDLDIIGTWIILSAVGVAIPLLLGWAPALRKSKARLLVRIWGCLVIVGAVCAFVAMRRSATVGVNYNFDDFRERETARYRCLNSNKSPLRTADAIVFEAERIFGRLKKGTLIWKFDTAAWVPMGFAVLSCLWRAKATAEKSAYRTFGIWLGNLVMVLAAIVLLATITLHEIFLLESNPGVTAIPTTEGLKAFEQWSCWAATGLVIVATVLNWVVEKTRPTQVPSSQLYEQESDNGVEKGGWQGILGKPTPAIIR
jgi:hypothetical protein